MNLEKIKGFFTAKSIAVVGASDRENSVGEILIRNIVKDFKGEIYPINPKRDEIKGHKAYKCILDLPTPSDMVVVCIPAKFIPATIEQCGERGIKSVVVITDGLDITETPEAYAHFGKDCFTATKAIADKYEIVIQGPNCVGLFAPNNGLNCSFTNIDIKAGGIALVSESGAISASIPDYAASVNVGFSHVFSLGEQMNLDFPSVINYLESDDTCKSVLIYMKKVHHKEDFLNAIKKCSAKKPVVIIKTADESIDGVSTTDLGNAGAVRIKSVNDIYSSLVMLNARVFPNSKKIAILTNSSGFSSISIQMIKDLGGNLIDITDETKSRLDNFLPETWSKTNPIDIVGDATGERYAKTLEALEESDEIDTVLTLYCPTNTIASEVAVEYTKVVKKSSKNVICAFVGGDRVLEGRKEFLDNNVPAFRTPEAAVHVILNMSRLHGRYDKK